VSSLFTALFRMECTVLTIMSTVRTIHWNFHWGFPWIWFVVARSCLLFVCCGLFSLLPKAYVVTIQSYKHIKSVGSLIVPTLFKATGYAHNKVLRRTSFVCFTFIVIRFCCYYIQNYKASVTTFSFWGIQEL